MPRSASGPQLILRHVSSAAARRHHMDLHTADQALEFERLLTLSARRVPWTYEPDSDYVVLADPDGNRFCVVQRSPVERLQRGDYLVRSISCVRSHELRQLLPRNPSTLRAQEYSISKEGGSCRHRSQVLGLPPTTSGAECRALIAMLGT